MVIVFNMDICVNKCMKGLQTLIKDTCYITPEVYLITNVNNIIMDFYSFVYTYTDVFIHLFTHTRLRSGV